MFEHQKFNFKRKKIIYMKRLLFIFIFCISIVSCNYIPDKSVAEKLSTEELSKAIKKDTIFTSFYEDVRNRIDELDDIKKAKYYELTYNRLFKYYKFMQDTTYWTPLYKNWEKEWENNFSVYLSKADSTVNYWRIFSEENTLDKYVKIELATIHKEYYSYIGDIKEVHLGFKLTPLQGKIEQLRFTYGYKAKINEDRYFKKHNCILTSPISSPTIKYWEVDYSDRNNFDGKTVETFLRDYNLEIDITHIRKDGVNINVDDFGIPVEVSNYFTFGKESMENFYKKQIIKELIYKDYMDKWEYLIKKSDEVKEKQDKLCFDFLEESYK